MTIEVSNGISIIRGQAAREGVTITANGIKWVGLYVDFQPNCDLIRDGTSWRRRASLTARLLHRNRCCWISLFRNWSSPWSTSCRSAGDRTKTRFCGRIMIPPLFICYYCMGGGNVRQMCVRCQLDKICVFLTFSLYFIIPQKRLGEVARKIRWSRFSKTEKFGLFIKIVTFHRKLY